MHYKLAPLILTPGKNASTTSDIYIAQPDSIKESLAGKLFILIEIEGKKNENLKIINFLIDNINHNYYQNEKILLREKISTLKVEHIFEAALAKTNKNFSDFLHNEKINININLINVITGIIFEDSIHFVNNGKNKAFLIYKHKIEGKKRGKIKEDDIIEYKISDIIEQAGANKKKNNDEKLFTNVISGKIPKSGNFIITNETLPEYISSKQLSKIISTLPPASAVEHMKNTLAEINSYVSFLGIVIKSTTIETENLENISNISTQESISTLNRTEETTENLLSPSGVANPKQWIKVPNFINDKVNKNKNTSLDRPFMLKDKIFGKRKSTFSFIKKTLSTISAALIHLINGLLHVGKNFTNKEKISSSSENIKQKTKQNFTRLFSFPGLSSKKSKILLALSLLFIVLFFVNISAIKVKNAKKEQLEKYENLVNQIKKKQNQAEAFLLYNNEESTKEIFPEIKNLLDTFPQETEEQIKQYQEFKEKYDLQNEKIRNVVRIENLDEIANFKNLNDNADAENIILTFDSSKIYTADSKESSIYILDLNDNSITTATDLDTSISKLSSPSLVNENTVYYLSSNNIIELSPKGNLNTLDINFSDIDKNLSVAGTYNSRLYLLSQKDNEIYKFTRSGDFFGNGQAWLSDKIDLSNAVDISIDGHIYILKNNGEITKLLKGEKIDFSLDIIDPPISAANAFYVSNDLKYIYILEPTNKRLVIFDKTGNFLMQYTSNQFTNLKDFSIDEKNKTMYFLNDNSILKTQATHF